VVEKLSSNHEALSSNLTIPRENKGHTERERQTERISNIAKEKSLSALLRITTVTLLGDITHCS
jgi:hypothetical protein